MSELQSEIEEVISENARTLLRESARELSNALQERSSREQPDEVTEIDDIFITHSTSSVGTIIKQAAVEKVKDFHSLSPSMKARVALGLNSILDLSDRRDGSQCMLFQPRDWQSLKTRLTQRLPECTLSGSLLSTVKKIEVAARTELSLAQKISRDAQASCPNRDEADALAIYDHCLELLQYHDHLFERDGFDFTEADMVVKIWGPVLERLFRQTKLRCKWGDSIGECSQTLGHTGLKVDLRIVTDHQTNKKRKEIDQANAEVSPHDASLSKTSSDRTKLLVEGKCILDNFVKAVSSEHSAKVPLLQLTGTCGKVITLQLEANGLYVAFSEGNLVIPHCAHALPKLRKTIQALWQFKNATTDLAGRRQNASAVQKPALVNTTMSRSPSPVNIDDNRTNWVRDTWMPPITKKHKVPAIPTHLTGSR